MYAEFATDPDVQSLAFEDQRHYVVLLCLKCSGTLDKDYPTSDRRYAVIRRTLGLDSSAVDEAKRRLIEAGLIDHQWQPLGWDHRQFLSDSSTERVKRFRERSRNVSVTPPDTEAETDNRNREEERAQGAHVVGLDLKAWSRWEAYRREIRKPIKPGSVQAAQLKLAGFGADQAAVVEESIGQGWTGLFPLKRADGKQKLTWKPPPDEPEAASA